MKSLSRTIRNAIKSSSVRVFQLGQRFGIDVLPRHFYSSIPDLRELQKHTSWRKPWSMVGVSGADVDAQMAFVRRCCPEPVRSRIALEELLRYATQENGAPGFGPIESLVLYCFIATIKPRRIVQVGAGFSTAIILRAAAEAGHRVELTCIDPFPTTYLRRLGQEGTIQLIPEPAQTAGLDTFTGIGDGDLLFIDSTHTVKVGSEVNRLILEVLPRLRRGCYVHLHDIVLPYDYTRTLFSQPFFPTESTLIHAYLADNQRCAICAALSMLHYARPAELRELFPEYTPSGNDDGLETSPGHFPSSLYLQMTADPIG
jgi:predicted O-methyltransferase YrrM